MSSQDEFIARARKMLDPEALSALADRIEVLNNSNFTPFGDTTPGELAALRLAVAEVRAIERVLARLERRSPRQLDFDITT